MRRMLFLLPLVLACGETESTREIDFAPDTAGPDSAVPAPVGPDTASVSLLTEQGLAPVRVGMTLDEAISALQGYLEVDGPLQGEGSEGCRYARGTRFPGFIMLEGNRVVRVDADSSVATVGGIRIGQPESEVMRAHPGIRVEPHKYVQEGHTLVLLPGAPADTLHRLVFETDGQKVTAMRGGIHPQVSYVEGCS